MAASGILIVRESDNTDPTAHLSSDFREAKRLRQPYLELSPPDLLWAIEEVVPRVKSAQFISLKLIDVAVLEHAIGEREFLRAPVDQQGTFNELATIRARERALAVKSNR
jgi:hypothetical protein